MKTVKLLELLLALTMMTAIVIPVFMLQPRIANAMPVGETDTDNIINWYQGSPSGLATAASLAWNPEYLKLVVDYQQHTATTVIVQGLDTYGQNIEAKVIVPPDASPQSWYVFNDTHTTPPRPVAFAKITGILQQNGVHGNMYSIYTEPDLDNFVRQYNQPYQEYLGQYHSTGKGWEPGQYYPSGNTPYNPTMYYVGHGRDTTPTLSNVPVEPSNPDPIKILINWVDTNGDLFPDARDDVLGTALNNADLVITGLDEHGNILNVTVHITAGVGQVEVMPDGPHTWSTICSITGGNSQDSYYILTHQKAERKLFSYTLRIDHAVIYPGSYDILAYPDAVNVTSESLINVYPGVTNITVALVDIDGNFIHSADSLTDVNLATTGGWIKPSNHLYIPRCNITAVANLTADTNARTINVTALVHVPMVDDNGPLQAGGNIIWSEEWLFAWTEMTFDGINSVQFDGSWPIHQMMFGYVDTYGVAYAKPLTPKPYLPPELGGPNVTDTETSTVKLDGPIYEVMIPLYPGCNLISSPVEPIMATDLHQLYGFYSPSWPTMAHDNGIPMELLFGKTSALDTIEAIFWYIDEGWSCYIPGVTTGTYFTDGVGYWIKAEKPCTLEISGVFMENGPFLPPTYELEEKSWSLVGVTSLTGISLSDYLQSTAGGYTDTQAGPVWVYYAKYGTWVRNPSWGLWPGEAFWIYNPAPRDQYIAP
jgi:hypothetical protein